MNSPIVSVIIPVYNNEKYLNEAIESMLNQTFTDFELIIINDGSTDKSEEIILSYNDSRIIYIKNQTNLGVVKTRTKALYVARSKYIVSMDADDISLPERIEQQYSFLEKNKNISVLGTSCFIIDKAGNTKGKANAYIASSACEWILLTSAPLVHPSVMFRKEDVLSVGGYTLQHKESLSENTTLLLDATEDSALWMNILSNNYKISNLPYFLLKYRVHGENFSIVCGDKQYQARIYTTTKHIENTYNVKLERYYMELLLNFHRGTAFIDTKKNLKAIYYYNIIYNQIEKKHNDISELRKLHSNLIVPLLLGYRKVNFTKFFYHLIKQVIQYPYFLRRIFYVIRKR